MKRKKEARKGAVIVIPAHNEEKTIGNVVESCMKAKKQGIVRDVIVVDDASKDNTAKIAREKGATVISLKQRAGKGRAFYEGLKRCRESNAKIMVTLDGDLLNLEVGHVRELIERVSTKEVKMAVMEVRERARGARAIKFVSGQRAIKLEAMEFLFLKGKGQRFSKAALRFIYMAQGYGLELALNALPSLKKSNVVFPPKRPLFAEKPLRKDTTGLKQERDLHRVRLFLDERERKAKTIREGRKTQEWKQRRAQQQRRKAQQRRKGK